MSRPKNGAGPELPTAPSGHMHNGPNVDVGYNCANSWLLPLFQSRERGSDLLASTRCSLRSCSLNPISLMDGLSLRWRGGESIAILFELPT